MERPDLMAGPASRRRILAFWIGLGLVLRLAAAEVAQRLADFRHTLCLFPDTNIYWSLATALRAGRPFVVSQWGMPHYALRTPGYPLFLAFCQWAFGPSPPAARWAQAALGAACVGVLYRIVNRIAPASATTRTWTPALVAAALLACDPWSISISALLLSEALFVPLMLLGLWGLAALWGADGPRSWRAIALGVGFAWGAAVLTKPSWLLFPPFAVVAWVIAADREGRRRAGIGALWIALGFCVVMAPWWYRNQQRYGRFVPTALWMGASLYDGVSPSATGASDMRFLEDPALMPLDEEAQDAHLTRDALSFAREHPGRVLRLAVVKLARYWSPWPNAAGIRSLPVVIVTTLVTLPIYGLILLGIWDRRRDARALVVLAGPLLYFCAIHMVFVSSVRYRLPGMTAALGLAGIGLIGHTAGRLWKPRSAE